jgi:hypothetical protein
VRGPPARRSAAAIVAAVTLACTVLLVGVFAPRWWGGDGGSFAPPSPVTSTRIEPASALFGDVLTARASTLVDTREIDPDTVRLYGRFGPYRVVSTERAVREHVGRAARIDHAFRLQCLRPDCLGVMEREAADGRRVTTPISFRPAEFVAETHIGRTLIREVAWRPVVVRSRLSPEDLATGEPRPPGFRAPETTYRVSPDLLGWLLVGAAALLAVAGGVLIFQALWGRRVIPRLRLPADLSGVERALVLARHAESEGDVAGERRALERLALELRRSGDNELAVAARRLAWSEPEPATAALEELVDEVARSGDGH